MFTCTHYSRGDEYHKERLEVVVKLSGFRYGKRMERVLDDLLTQTKGVSPAIYNHLNDVNCDKNNCFVTKYLPSLISATDNLIRGELGGSLHSIHSDELTKKRYEMAVDALRRLELVGMYFDEANERSAKKTEALEKIKNKFDLYRVASGDPKAVKSLIDFQTEVTSKLLLKYAPFLAKIYLSLLAHEPNRSGILSSLTPGRKDYDSQRSELEDLANAAKIDVQYSTGYFMWETQRKKLPKKVLAQEAKAILDAQIEAIKNYSMLQLIRLGALYIAPIRDTFSDSQKRLQPSRADYSYEEMGLIYDEMSNIGNAIINTVYDTANKYLEKMYGKPNSGFVLLLGGANARKEFPSFDYDSMATYSEEGATGGHIFRGISHRKYFNKLNDLIIEIANDIGHHCDKDFQLLNFDEDFNKGNKESIVCTFNDLERKLKSQNNYSSRTAISNLIVVAGDANLGDRVLKIAREKCLDPTIVEEHLAWRYASREYRREEYSRHTFNVKNSVGGLRDINEAIWMNNTVNSRIEPNILRGIDNLPLNIAEKKRLKDSYLFMINLRIRLDFYYGRNNKDLPQNGELKRFVAAIGYEKDDPVKKFREEYRKHRHNIRKLTDGAVNTILKPFPDIEKKAQELRDDYFNKVQQRLEQGKKEKAGKKAENIEKIIEKNVSFLIEKGNNSFISSSWGKKVAAERGFELE